VLADFATVKEALALVKVQFTLLPGATAAAFNATAPVIRFGVAVPPAPMPVHVADARPKPVGMDSVIVVGVDVAVSVIAEVETAVPDVAVVRFCVPTPLLPLKVNGPTAPLDILVNVTVAGLSSLFRVQVAD
jgi:hypothetical protein